MTGYDKKNLNSVRLLTAYHTQCVGCHDAMQLEKGSSMNLAAGDRCAACHKKKADGPAEITELKNENVVKQNTKIILNVWRPK
jgi:hypothetical protein